MLRRLLRNLRYRNWKASPFVSNWSGDIPPPGAFFYDVESGDFIVSDSNPRWYTPDNWPIHVELMDRMRVPGRDYSQRLRFLFEHAVVRGFFHKGEHDDWSRALVPDYLFLEAIDKAHIVAVCDRIVMGVPFLRVQWDVWSNADEERYVPAEHGSDLVRTIAYRKPSYIALVRAQAAYEQWPDPERA